MERYIALLNKEGISVEKAFLYGSHSTGNATESSDFDLMIVTNNEDADDDLVAGKMWSLTIKINTKIEPFLIGHDRFEQSQDSPLIEMVKETGIAISV